VLSQHTTTANKCWFCLWDGYGDLNTGPNVRAYFVGSRAGRMPGKRVRPNPQRSYFLFSGPIAKAAAWRDGPSLWWPDDRSWCVASEIDLPYTYVGGSEQLIAEILKHPALEALPAAVGDGITFGSDKVNVQDR
jgi:hypothetical protein